MAAFNAIALMSTNSGSHQLRMREFYCPEKRRYEDLLRERVTCKIGESNRTQMSLLTSIIGPLLALIAVILLGSLFGSF